MLPILLRNLKISQVLVKKKHFVTINKNRVFEYFYKLVISSK